MHIYELPIQPIISDILFMAPVSLEHVLKTDNVLKMDTRIKLSSHNFISQRLMIKKEVIFTR